MLDDKRDPCMNMVSNNIITHPQAPNTRESIKSHDVQVDHLSVSSSAVPSLPDSAATGTPTTTKTPPMEHEKEEFRSAPIDATGPAFSQRAYLKPRQNNVDLERKMGTTELINPESATLSSIGSTTIGGPPSASSTVDVITTGVHGVGWHCKVCDCFLKDSLTYLDHINGRKHQRYLGYSMRVEKSKKEEVANKLAELAELRNKKAKKASADTCNTTDNVDKHDFECIGEKKDEDVLRRKAERVRKREERKKKKQRLEIGEELEQEDVNEEMASMMGFSSFA